MGPFILGQRIVTINVDTMDRYVRTVGKVILPDVNSMNRELVRAGYACWYRTYISDKTLGCWSQRHVSLGVVFGPALTQPLPWSGEKEHVN
jgi:endonuclease YncB( thermonuclease family)